MKYYLIIVPICGLLFSSCQQALVPSNYSVKEKNHVHNAHKEGIVIYVEYLEKSNGLMVFDLDVQNHTNAEIHVDPQKFQMKSARIYDNQQKRVRKFRPTHTITHQALTETEVDEHFRKSANKKEGANAALAILALGLIATDMYLDAKDADDEDYSEQDESFSIARDIGVLGGLAAASLISEGNEMSALKAHEDRHYLYYEYLDARYLEPGTSNRGKLFFRHKGELSTTYRLYLPIENVEFVVDFRQANTREIKMLLDDKYK